MSNIIHKVKDALTGDKHSAPEGTHGPHGTRTANAADPRVDSDRDHRAAGTTGAGGLTGHSANTTAGPHSSNMANKVDPRVDSDRDGSNTLGGNNYGSSNTSGLTGTHGTHGTTGGLTGHSNTTAGPHSSDMANKVDPRVDSDRDGSKTMGGNNYGSSNTSGLTGTHGTHGTTGGLTGSHGFSEGTHGTSGTHGYSEGNAGPHNSKMANTLDPRVDSDRDGSRTVGNNSGSHNPGVFSGSQGASGMTGSHGGLTGSHNSSGLTGTHGNHGEHQTLGHAGAAIGGTHGTGPAPNTAGPHSSDMLNKVDPRVDSNLDGSKTLGQDKTYSQSSTTHKDPLDAAQVPPSVLKKSLGDPVIAHNDHAHDRERRHSVTTHQEKFSGV